MSEVLEAKYLKLEEVLENIKSVDIDEVNKLYSEAIDSFNKKIIVLDDDPTGVQTVHGISVVTDWEKSTLIDAFKEECNMFFILTNSRSFTEEETVAVHKEIAQNIMYAANQTNKEFLVMSRGDSTLRGHYPAEPETLKECIENDESLKVDGEIVYPFFKEGGRLTINNVHYVLDKDNLVPASETDFAKDRSFGYENSDLAMWIEEKTKGQYKHEDVVQISLEELRNLEIDNIYQKLMGVTDFNKVVVNAVDYIDTKIFTIALIKAMNNGKNFMFRTAAALTKVLGGVSDKELLKKEELVDLDNTNGGIVVIGSHVKKTTIQFEELRKIDCVKFIEFNQHLVLDDKKFQDEVDRVVKQAEESIVNGKTAVVYTRRERLDIDGSKEEELRLTVKIAEGVKDIVGNLTVRPKFIVAKGGITSSDIGTKALRVKKALVAGQIQPGIPVWKTGNDSKFAQLPYIIFPGNVGSDDALRKVVELLN